MGRRGSNFVRQENDRKRAESASRHFVDGVAGRGSDCCRDFDRQLQEIFTDSLTDLTNYVETIEVKPVKHASKIAMAKLRGTLQFAMARATKALGRSFLTPAPNLSRHPSVMS